MPNPFATRSGPFIPNGSTPVYATAGATQALAIPSGAEIRITFNGSASCYIAFGATNGVTATSANIEILPGTVEVLGVPDGANFLALFGTGGTFGMIGGSGN